MIEIKFRVFDMMKKDFADEDQIMISPKGEIFIRPECYIASYSDRFVISQYTGLNDCFKNPIFDGDILSLPWMPPKPDELYLVYYNDEIAQFRVKKLRSTNPQGIQLSYINPAYFIAGNMFKTPELLK